MSHGNSEDHIETKESRPADDEDYYIGKGIDDDVYYGSWCDGHEASGTSSQLRQTDNSTSTSYAMLSSTTGSDLPEDQGWEDRYFDSMGVPGVARLSLSPLTQKIIGCVIDENVTTEYPWVYVRRQIIEDNLELHPKSSDFLPVKPEIERYRAPEVLVGYAPTIDPNEGQFYICLTERSREEVERRIDELRREQQEWVRAAVFKEPRSWIEWGSAAVVDDAIVKPTRPFFDIEMKTKVEQLKLPAHLVSVRSEDRRDGYVEVVPHREIFANVEKILVDRGSRAVPRIKTNDAQTETAVRVNAWSQCTLDQESGAPMVDPNDKKIRKELEKFIKAKIENMCYEVHANATWDVYKSDYAELAERSEAKVTRTLVIYEERQIYYEGNLCRDRVIGDLSWHPQWTGVMAAVYTPKIVEGKSRKKECTLSDNQVLVWSFDDSLKPKLVLEAKALITSVSFCPRNSNIVIGGCDNGLVVIWDIAGKIEEAERPIVRTEVQMKAHFLERRDALVVRQAATSSSRDSHTDRVTKIEWLSPYRKINDRGMVQDLPADTAEADLSQQLVTSSNEGTIAFWDLTLPPEDEDEPKGKKKKNLAKQPRDPEQPVSEYNRLDGTYKPTYVLIVTNPDTKRNVPVSALSLRYPSFEKEPITRSTDVTKRGCYNLLAKKDPHDQSPLHAVFVGTGLGECGLVTWEGFEYSTGLALNKENTKWLWLRHAHDGPVSHAVRSPHLHDLVLTVGGRSFAIWRDDFDEPIFQRESEFGYTSCCWDGGRKSAVLLGRDDGTVEIWDLMVKVHEPSATKSLSGNAVTGVHAHELPLASRCVGVCDHNGAFRIFVAPRLEDPASLDWMRRYVDNEISRLEDLKFARQEEEKRAETEEQRTTEKSGVEREPVEEKPDGATKSKKKTYKQLVEESRERWVGRELDRMQRAILTKKGLREEELERRQEPVLRMKREAEEKEARRRRIMASAPELFQEAVASHFPRHRRKFLTAFTLPPGTPDSAGTADDEQTEGKSKSRSIKEAADASEGQDSSF